MSPEQVNGSDIDGRSDLWSAGVTLFELVTGKLPFAGDTNSVFRQILNSPVPEIPNNIPLSDELNQILRCAMHKQREERFSTGDLFAAELRRVLPFAQSHPWTPPPTEAKVTDGLTQATIVAFSLTPELNQVPRPVYETHPSLAQKGVEGQPADPGIYNLPDVGFTHRPGGEVIISSGRFSLIAVRNRMLDARPKVVTKLIIYSFFGYCALLMLHLSWKIGSEDLLGGAVVVIASVIAVAWLSISATIQAARLLERLRIYTRCTKCRRPLSPRSVWTRFVKSKIEIELGYRDCLAALKGGFWEDAAKLVCIHGAERVSLYASRSIDTPLRYNLQFYECNACILHVARLTTDELVEEKWLTRPEFVQATSAGIRTETTR